MRICVIGAGLFGGIAACKLAKKGHLVDLVEKDSSILSGASRHNHNRVHFGYHYLRSIATAQESREGIPSFIGLFGNALLTDFPNYYCMAAEGSKSTPKQFEDFCDRVDIGWLKEDPPSDILNSAKVSACYRVPEPVFDYGYVKRIVEALLQRDGVNVCLSAQVDAIDRIGGNYRVKTPAFTRDYDVIVNCTYSGIDRINEMLGVPCRNYLYEDVVIPIFGFEHPVFGLTIMDGGFCSVEPHGFRQNEFLLYHVKYSVVNRRLGGSGMEADCPFDLDNIYARSAEFLPFLSKIKHLGVYRTIRIVMESDDDARLSMVYNDLPNYWSVLSGKVTTCVEVANRLTASIPEP